MIHGHLLKISNGCVRESPENWLTNLICRSSDKFGNNDSKGSVHLFPFVSFVIRMYINGRYGRSEKIESGDALDRSVYVFFWVGRS